MDKALQRMVAMENMPPITPVLVPGSRRFDVIAPLAGSGLTGIELGVAAGSFSARMVQTGRFAHFFGVDVYGDGHNVQEYKKALRAVGLLSDYRLLRMTFDQALDLFPDGFFDFIYCDGYAHTGEEGGRTLTDWYPKLKPGGVMAGDDYDLDAWPLVVWAVHHTAAQVGATLHVTDLTSDEPYNRFRSWYFVRPADAPTRLEPCGPLMDLGDLGRMIVDTQRREKARARRRRENG